MRTLFAALLSVLVCSQSAWAKCPVETILKPGFKTAFVPVGTPDQLILLEIVPAQGRNPEGAVFHVCQGDTISENCPLLFANGIVIPTQILLKGATGFRETFKAYVEVLGVVGALVGINAELPTSYGIQGITPLVTLSPIDRLRRARFFHELLEDTFHNLCSSNISQDKQIGTEPVAKTFDDMATDLQAMVFGIVKKYIKERTPGTLGYQNRMAIHDHVNEAYQATKAREAACAADASKCGDNSKGSQDASKASNDGTMDAQTRKAISSLVTAFVKTSQERADRCAADASSCEDDAKTLLATLAQLKDTTVGEFVDQFYNDAKEREAACAADASKCDDEK
jgi:hypothetical protein